MDGGGVVSLALVTVVLNGCKAASVTASPRGGCALLNRQSAIIERLEAETETEVQGETSINKS